MSKEFASSCYTVGQINAMIKKIVDQIGENGPKLLLQGKVRMIVERDIFLKFVGKTNFIPSKRKFSPVTAFSDESKEIDFFGILDFFKTSFLEENEKIEENVGRCRINYGDVYVRVPHQIIIDEIGGTENSETNLYDIYTLLQGQPHGEDGHLLNNGQANIFYIRDTKRHLVCVQVCWDSDGWIIDAQPIERSYTWTNLSRVFYPVID